MNRDKGQVLIICLWILAILTVLAVSLGHRAALGLKLSQYQVDKLKSLALAKAGLNVAVEGTPMASLSSGSRQGTGVAGWEDFKEIRLPGEPEGYATVGYRSDATSQNQTVYGVTDEEGKININKAPRELLVELLHAVNIQDDALALNMCAWRGDKGLPVPDYSESGYANKGAPFTSPEELVLVKGIDRRVLDNLKDYITVWGEGTVNVNTASKVVLDSLVAYSRNQISSGENDPRGLVELIMVVRPVESLGDLKTKLQEQRELSVGETNVLNELSEVVGVRSAFMHVFSTGRLDHSQVSSTIECVLNRGKGRVVYWHEN